MIIDSHVHYGNSFWGNFPPEFLLNILGDSVDIAICSNLEGIDSGTFKDELECNLEMLDVAKKYHQLKALAVCQPNNMPNADNIRYLLKEHKEFIGLKLHPECMKLPADSNKYDDYLNVAQEFNKPCLYHSGHIKSRFSSPELIYKKAKEFPTVPIILGHLSTGPKASHEAATEILIDSIETNSANLYVDVSWIDFGTGNLDDTIYLIEKLKHTQKGDYTHRILWASDAPVGEFNQIPDLYKNNLENFKEKIQKHFNDNQLLENLLCNNARELYGI